jgi:hypothetical protein
MYIKGKAITVAEITVADQEKTTVVSKIARNAPRGPCLPNARSNPSPTTVGGSTRGNMNKPSNRCLNFPAYRAIQRAAAIPSRNVIVVAARTVLSEIQNGDR